MHRLTGYCDRWSLRAGGKIAFHVASADDLPYQLSFKRIHCADPNPNGPGYRAERMPTKLDGEQRGFARGAYPGSYAEAVVDVPPGPLTLSITALPTAPGGKPQIMLAVHLAGLTVTLGIDEAGCAIATAGSASLTGPKLRARQWYDLELGLADQKLTLSALPILTDPDTAPAPDAMPGPVNPGGIATVTMAARRSQDGRATSFFNGKLERPMLHGRETIASWDFSANIPSQVVPDTWHQAAHARLINLPTRAVTGSTWYGTVHDWKVEPTQFAAIHFHDDDLGDVGWPESFVLDVPRDWPSGLYAAEITRADGAEDMIPFFVRPAKGAPTADIAVLFPTFSYQVYSCFVRPGRGAEIAERAKAWGALQETPDMNPQFGLSTYNLHSDGSGVAITSMLRPQLDTRPRQISLMDPSPEGSGTGRLGCDTYITEWLSRIGVSYDVITDHDLDEEGWGALTPYRVLIAAQHPEYHSWVMLNALDEFLRGGGRLMYLGGNGFYWRAERSKDAPHALEVRRAESGIRVWATEPGESYHQFGGGYGGLWRRVGRPAHKLVGNGFSAQGRHLGFPYVFTDAVRNPRLDFLRAGIEAARPGEKFGDRGFMGGGAAGFELDSFDVGYGSPAHALVLAKGIVIHDDYGWVNEDMLVHRHPRRREDWSCADMLFFETPAGGAVFSVGSMTFVGSLLVDGGQNSLSAITANVVRRFRDPKQFVLPEAA
jgi:N,N-dimethylformamidase